MLGFEDSGVEKLLKHISEGGQQEIVDAIGSFDHRFHIFEYVVYHIQPIKTHLQMQSRCALMRIGYALLPEVLEESSWEQYKAKITEFTTLLSMEVSEVMKRPPKVSPEMSIELMIIVCLPLMGFNGSPLSYSSIFDLERAFHREIAMRILRAMDAKRACNNLVHLEEKVALSLNMPAFQMGDEC